MGTGDQWDAGRGIRREELTMMLKFGTQRSCIGERLKMENPDRRLWGQC